MLQAFKAQWLHQTQHPRDIGLNPAEVSEIICHIRKNTYPKTTTSETHSFNNSNNNDN